MLLCIQKQRKELLASVAFPFFLVVVVVVVVVTAVIAVVVVIILIVVCVCMPYCCFGLPFVVVAVM